MKYLILVIVSLFCLSSFSDHTENPMSEEEKARYHELAKKIGKTDKEWKEFHLLNDKKEKQSSKIWAHFNTYMVTEMTLDRMIKVDNPEDFKSMSYRAKFELFKHTGFLQNLKKPDCTKERLEKKECPKAPYQTIYWAKKYLESGYQVGAAALFMSDFLEYYVISKTDMENNEEFFHLLNYIAWYFFYESTKVRVSDYYKKLEKQKKENPERFKKIQKACDEDTTCSDPFAIEMQQNRLKEYKNKLAQLKDLLSEKQKVIADKMIDDLIQKWTQKYGDNIYLHKKYNKRPDETELRREFLEKNYPHH